MVEPDRLKTGQRPRLVSSREVLLAAARAQFAQRGFDGATKRSIAAEAGVDSGLIQHFSGDKDGLFAATVEMPTGVITALKNGVAQGSAGLGEPRLLGVAPARNVVRIEPVALVPVDELIAVVAPDIEQLLADPSAPQKSS